MRFLHTELKRCTLVREGVGANGCSPCRWFPLFTAGTRKTDAPAPQARAEKIARLQKSVPNLQCRLLFIAVCVVFSAEFFSAGHSAAVVVHAEGRACPEERLLCAS